jgi:hypothetical protein
MKNDPRILSPEEMRDRFADIRAIHDGSETPETIAKKWKGRGRPITVGQVKTYCSRLKSRIERGDNLDNLAENHTWSDIIWELHGLKKRGKP